uniref:RalA binding protein 1 n=1 Tax=Pipistrellus kuhlii TaxID=59472 RepID=A0A7J7YAP0_PIPKU|nr:ralA binding protein 1 [Pipistrellus kuhlii]
MAVVLPEPPALRKSALLSFLDCTALVSPRLPMTASMSLLILCLMMKKTMGRKKENLRKRKKGRKAMPPFRRIALEMKPKVLPK